MSSDDDDMGGVKKGSSSSLVVRIRKALWGDLPREEYKKIGMLSAIFLMIVGTYWLLRTQKDALFMKITGAQHIPKAKMMSFVMMVPLILGYSKLVDAVEKHAIFYIICGTYGTLFLLISMALMIPGVGPSDNVAPSATRLLGWTIYLGIESFGSLCVPLFWSFVNSISDIHTAKSGFGLITWGAQFGSIMGPTIGRSAKFLGLPTLMLMGSVGIFTVPVMVWYFVHCYPRCREGVIQKQSTSMLEGIRLLLKYKYLLGVFCIATFYEVIGTILDYQLKFQLNQEFKSAADVAVFMGSFGQWANGLTFFFALFGTGFFINNMGLTACLVLFPVTLSMVIAYVWLHSSVNVLFYAMVVIKGLSYALNNPCKEILYLPTTKDVKFKAKSWIDMFGGRAAKSLGSLINAQFATAAALAYYTGPINFAVIGVWVMVALRTGRLNQYMVEHQITLGQEKPAAPVTVLSSSGHGSVPPTASATTSDKIGH